MIETDLQYRILQNSISRFSIYLNKALCLQDISNCLLQNTKYLFNYSCCRFHFYQKGRHICYTVSRHSSRLEQGSEPFFTEEESGVFATLIPVYKKEFADGAASSEEKETWIWKFTYHEEAGMVVSVQSGGECRFMKDQIPLVKIAGEMLYTKTSMVLLLEDLSRKQQALAQSNKKLEDSNNLISKILSQQQQTIDDRTRSLTLLNTKLVELIQFNSHNIREPLTRIMGLMNLYEMVSPQDFFTDYWPLLDESVHDLDQTIRQVITRTEKIDKHENIFD